MTNWAWNLNILYLEWMQKINKIKSTEEIWLEFWVAFEKRECLATEIIIRNDSDSKRWVSHKLFALRIEIIFSPMKKMCFVRKSASPQCMRVCVCVCAIAITMIFLFFVFQSTIKSQVYRPNRRKHLHHVVYTHFNNIRAKIKTVRKCSVRWPNPFDFTSWFIYIKCHQKTKIFSPAHMWMWMGACVFVRANQSTVIPTNNALTTNVSLNLDFYLLDEWKNVDWLWYESKRKVNFWSLSFA